MTVEELIDLLESYRGDAECEFVIEQENGSETLLAINEVFRVKDRMYPTTCKSWPCFIFRVSDKKESGAV